MKTLKGKTNIANVLTILLIIKQNEEAPKSECQMIE